MDSVKTSFSLALTPFQEEESLIASPRSTPPQWETAFEAPLEHKSVDNLLVRICEGDSAAFEELYRARYRALWDFAYRYLRCHAAAEDLVHDVFASLWVRHARLDLRVTLDVYLFGAVRNAAIQRVRHQYVERATETARGMQPLAMGALPPLPDAAIIQRDRSKLVNAALTRLSTSQREVLILHWYYGMQYMEIAQALKITVEAARQHGSRGQRALRVLLEPQLGSTGTD